MRVFGEKLVRESFVPKPVVYSGPPKLALVSNELEPFWALVAWCLSHNAELASNLSLLGIIQSPHPGPPKSPAETDILQAPYSGLKCSRRSGKTSEMTSQAPERKRHSRVSGRRLSECLTVWRRGWDSNPRYGRTVHLISNQAHSTTLAPLHWSD